MMTMVLMLVLLVWFFHMVSNHVFCFRSHKSIMSKKIDDDSDHHDGDHHDVAVIVVVIDDGDDVVVVADDDDDDGDIDETPFFLSLCLR